MLSNVISAIATNFQTLWSEYGQPGTVPFFFGPKYITIQTAPPQITVVLFKEKFNGPEQHQILPYQLATWTANTSYPQGMFVQPTPQNFNGFYFKASQSGAGQSGLTEPSWPQTIAGTVVDGTVTWTNIGTVPPNLVGDPRELNRCWSRVAFYCWGNPSVLNQWTPNTTIVANGTIAPTTINQNGFFYQSTAGGFTNVSEPIWPISVGSTVLDGTVLWVNMGITDNFRIHDWDQVDTMRTVLAATIHYTAPGQYKIEDGSWYDKTDQLIMDGFTYKLFADFLVPMPDIAESVAEINSFQLTQQLTLLVPI